MKFITPLIIIFLLVAILIFLLVGCSSGTQNENPRLTQIWNNDVYRIHRDNMTGVLYLSRYQGGVCVMVNPDGTPCVDEAWIIKEPK